jgi:hypothetical protein
MAHCWAARAEVSSQTIGSLTPDYICVGLYTVLCCHDLKDCSAGGKVVRVVGPLGIASVARVVKAVLRARQAVHGDQHLNVVLTGPA